MLREVLVQLWSRLLTAIQDAPPGALRLGAILGALGIALAVYQMYGIGGAPPKPPSTSARAPPTTPGASTSAAMASTSAAAPSTTAPPVAAKRAVPPPAVASDPMAIAASKAIGGVRKATIVAPGVLLEQASAEALTDGASLCAGVGPLLKGLASVADVFVLTHVDDDLGEAIVRGALEGAGLVGTAPGQIPPHRLLFCSTLGGKVSIVRQIEPDVHVDSHAVTVAELQRYVPKLVHVHGGGSPAASAPNITAYPSFAAFIKPS